MYHFLRGVNHLKCLETPFRYCQCRTSLSIYIAQSSGLCSKPNTNQYPCCVPGQAQRKWLSQDVHLLFGGFRGGGEVSVGKGRGSKSGYLEGPILWLRYEYTWYQNHTRLSRKYGITSAKSRNAGKMETAMCYQESLS